MMIMNDHTKKLTIRARLHMIYSDQTYSRCRVVIRLERLDPK